MLQDYSKNSPGFQKKKTIQKTKINCENTN